MPGLVQKPLFVTDGQLDSESWAFLRPSDPNLPLDELRKRFNADGYVFLKGLIPRGDVLKAREQYFSMVEGTGVLEEGTPTVDGIFNFKKSHHDYPSIGAGHVDGNGRPGGEAAKDFVDLALQAHYEDWYTEGLCKHPALVSFIERFSNWNKDTLGFKRTLLRNNIPNSKPIGVHYDQIFLRYGEPDSITAWIPIGDISLHGGGLIYMEDSIKIGEDIEREFDEQATKSGLTDEQKKSAFNSNMMSTGFLSEHPITFAKVYGKKWLCSSYEAGDVVLHNAYAIHASLVNHDPANKIRLATDVRFCDSTKKVDTVRVRNVATMRALLTARSDG